MSIDFTAEKPIYQQLIDRITGEIIKGHVKPGDKLPSVREYAVEVGVNANTMQRVYKELETMGITETKRGQGTFVTDNNLRLEQLRNDVKDGLVQSFLTNIESLGFTKQEMIEHIQKRGWGKKDD